MILNVDKYDNRFFSAKIAAALKSTNAATIIQQLNYWTQKEAGVVIDGKRWIYNTFEQWILEQFEWLSTWQLRKEMGKLRSLGIVEVVRHNAKRWNQTNFYYLNYDRLAEFMNKFLNRKKAESTEISEMCVTSSQGEGSSLLEMRDTDISPYGTKNTNLDFLAAEQLAAAPQKIDFEADKNQNKGEIPKERSTSLKGQNKSTYESKRNTYKKKKIPRDVEQKINNNVEQKINNNVGQRINNKKWEEHLNQIENIGISINKTIVSMVKMNSTKEVEGAIEIFKLRKRDKYIPNASGYFVQALKENWSAEPKAQRSGSDEEQNQEVNSQDVFRYWYQLAREFGYCSDQEMREGQQWVNMSLGWETWEAAMKRGFTLEYLKKIRDRNIDRNR